MADLTAAERVQRMKDSRREKGARQLAQDIIARYEDVMRIDDEIRDAIIVKSIALIALAYGIPPVQDEPLDVKDTIEKLTSAEAVLAQKGIIE